MNPSSCKIGMIGLGVMGRNLLLNIADHGFPAAGFDLDAKKVEDLQKQAEGRQVHATTQLTEFLALLERPRVIMMLVPAGAPVDAVIRDILPKIDKGDILIDGGNSFFKDTNLREKTLAEKGIHFVGMGVSGGESGARHGPSLMPGGNPDAYRRMKTVFEAIAAKAHGEPCVSYLGKGSSGHYVKMVHNGIEYGMTQLIAESYDFMHRGLGLSNQELHDVFHAWNQSELSCYLLEITTNIFKKIDPATGKHLVDLILDAAKQKGTGMWTSENAMELHIPTNTIDCAVAWRNLSALEEERRQASTQYPLLTKAFSGDRKVFLQQLFNAFYVGMTISYAQGMALLQHASSAYEYQLDMEAIARIWRGGCIIRAHLLEPMRAAFQKNPKLPNLLLDSTLSQEILKRQGDLRQIIHMAIDLGIPLPCLTASLSYFDAYRSARLPANLIQAQRDYFGAHTYERVDAKGVFHTQWESPE
jgi:6-phosphogluconate dehydrogenase